MLSIEQFANGIKYLYQYNNGMVTKQIESNNGYNVSTHVIRCEEDFFNDFAKRGIKLKKEIMII